MARFKLKSLDAEGNVLWEFEVEGTERAPADGTRGELVVEDASIADLMGSGNLPVPEGHDRFAWEPVEA